MQAKRTKNLVNALLLVAVVAIIAAVPAAAQVSFNVTSSAQTVRTEGQTETAGSVNMNWASGTAISSGSSITLTYATATVLANSPYVTAKIGGTTCLPTQGNPSVAGTGNCANMTVTSSGASVVISFSTGSTPPAGGFMTGDYIQVAQTRLNIAGVTGAQLVSGTTPLAATISGNSPSVNTITFNQNQVTVASISNSLNVKLGTVTGAASAVAASISTCNVSGATLNFAVNATEIFPAAFTSTADEAAYTPNFAGVTGVTVNVVLSNVPTGLVITPTAPTLPGTVTLAATPAAQTSTGAGTPLTFSYTITMDSTAAVESIVFQFSSGLASGTIAPTLSSQSLASPQNITAQVYLGPITATPVVRFTQLNYPTAPISVATVSDCVTVLLFPYVTSELGFDTSIQIANTTLDGPALGTQLASKQPGTCKFVLYPTAAATGVLGPAMNSYVTPTIQAGGSFQVLMSKAYPKLSGYMYAVCNFLNAHAFGYFVGPSSNGGVLTQGELALVVPTTRTAGGTESLTQ